MPQFYYNLETKASALHKVYKMRYCFERVATTQFSYAIQAALMSELELQPVKFYSFKNLLYNYDEKLEAASGCHKPQQKLSQIKATSMEQCIDIDRGTDVLLELQITLSGVGKIDFHELDCMITLSLQDFQLVASCDWL